MINYAIYDTTINDLFISFNSTLPPSLPQKNKNKFLNVNTQKFVAVFFDEDELEDISDDGIYVSQFAGPVIQTLPHKSAHQRRTQEARSRRSCIRNNTLRIRRYQYYLQYNIYYRFTMKLVKEILRQNQIKHTHVKVADVLLIIVFKHDMLKQQYQQQLSEELFTWHNYYHQHHRHYQHHHRHQHHRDRRHHYHRYQHRHHEHHREQ
ncbi:unnamed protein product [Rotaria socialis]|uniref:Uncharacterized protein n=1 Tax=Rotaria socialis TaxID=392032 RepID=A0A818AE41_9BILA|nr:unnamed protein product [Rotaria socialis]CAF4736502.1 unnamed protein product [Rotaria socialis]